MKILLYSINFSPELTGVGKYTGEAAAWFSENGHSVKVITAPPYYPSWAIGKGYSSLLYKLEQMHKLKVFRCPLYIPRRPNGLKRILHLSSFAISSFPVLILNAFWRPDLIFMIEPPLLTAPGALLISRLCGAKIWLHVQDFEVDAAFELKIIPSTFRKGIEFIEKLIMSKFFRVSTISEKMMEKLGKKGVLPEKRILFPNWVDCQQIFPADGSPLRGELKIAEDAVVALYSGNMGEKQGLEIIVETARKLQNHDNLIFIMCGTGASHKRLKKMAAELNNIRWLPLQPVERLNDLLNLADIHLLPQREDAADLVMPSKLIGMMASGRPVLATASEGTQIAEALKSCGKTVPPGDVDAFLVALCDLAKDETLRNRLGSEARQYAIKHWDKETVLSGFAQSLNIFAASFEKPSTHVHSAD